MSQLGPTQIEQIEDSRKEHRQWVEEIINKKEYTRKPELTESLAVGSKAFVENVGRELKSSRFEKKIKEINGHYALREPEATYNASFEHKNELLSSENRFYLNLNIE